MALNPDALKGMVGLAMTREELVIHTAGGLQITNAADVKDDAVIIYRWQRTERPNARIAATAAQRRTPNSSAIPSHFPTTHWTRVFLRRIRHPR